MLSATGREGRTQCILLEMEVGPKCLAALIGIGPARLRRSIAGAPDLRFGKREHRSQPGSWTVDSFLQLAYDSIAETLPDQFPGQLKIPYALLSLQTIKIKGSCAISMIRFFLQNQHSKGLSAGAELPRGNLT